MNIGQWNPPVNGTTTAMAGNGSSLYGSSGQYQNNIYDYGNTWPQTYQPYYSYWYPFYVDRIVEPSTCMGKAHVFECEHVSACKCGAIKRIMPREKKGTTR